MIQEIKSLLNLIWKYLCTDENVHVDILNDRQSWNYMTEHGSKEKIGCR